MHNETYDVSCVSGFKFFNKRNVQFETLFVRRVKNQFGNLTFEKSYWILLEDIECRDVRAQPWLPRNGHHNQTSVVHDGKSYDAKCTDGFMFFNNKTKTFVGKGVASLNVKNELGVLKLPDHPSLSTDDLECQEARCDTPLVKNGTLFTYERPRDQVNETKLKHGQKNVIKCNAGYQLFNHSNKQSLTSEEFDILCNFTKIAPDTHPVCQLSQLNSAKNGCQYPNISSAVLEVNGEKAILKNPHGTKGEVRCRANFAFAEGDLNNGSVQCQNGVWVPNVTCRPIVHASKESATNARNSSTISPTEKITATYIDKTTTEPMDNDYSDNILSTMSGHETALGSDNKSLSNSTHKPENEPKVLTTQGPPVEASTVTYITSPSADEFNSTDDSQDSGRCTLTKSTDITYWNASHNTELSTPLTVINRSRVRVRLTCPQMIGEYIDYYHGDEADDRNEKEAEIECVDGEFTMHYLTCETAETDGQSSSYSTNDPCKTIANGKITDRGKSVECETNHHLAFSNGMDTSLYSRYSCKCDTTFGIFSCLGSRVACKPNNCTMPSNLEQGLTLYDVKERQFISGANRYQIPHGGEIIFNCAPSGDKYYEPSNRTFNCYQGSWVAQHLSGKEPWSFDNNVTFPACRPVNCSVNHCKFGGYCIQDFKCQCPQHTTGEHCEHQVCKGLCLNGGSCREFGQCECQGRFHGTWCELVGCTKPGGNIRNLPKDLYFHQENLTITNRNCDPDYFLGKGHNTITCDRGVWSENVNCEKAACSQGCQNGGTCTEPNKCTCKAGFYGPSCEFANIYHIYHMRVVTSNQLWAGTDVNMMINLWIDLIGSKGKTGGIELEGPFYVNGVKMFNKNLLDVGTIQTIKLGVYRSQMLDGWNPKRVDILDIKRQHIYVFEHDESEVDNKLITLHRRGCITLARGYLTGERGETYKYKHNINTVYGCMMFCLENNCVQAEYRTNDKYCGIDTRDTRTVIDNIGHAFLVLTPQCVIT